MLKGRHLLAIFLAALAVRVGVALATAPQVYGDALEYDTIAVNLAAGHGFAMTPGVPTPIRGPGYPFFLALLYGLLGHSPAAALLAQALLGALLCPVVFDIALRLFNCRTALLSAWLTALFPVLAVYTGLLLTETLFTLFLALTVAAFVRSEGGERPGPLFLSGLLLGLTTLIRATTILFPFGLFLALLASGTGRTFRKTAVALLAFGLALAPWTARNWARFHTFTLVSTGASIGVYATGCEAEGRTYEEGKAEMAAKRPPFDAAAAAGGPQADIAFDREMKREGMEKIKAHLAGYARVVLLRLPKYWLSSHSSVFGSDRPVGEYLAKKDYFPVAVRAALLLLHGALLAAMLLGLYFARGAWRRAAVLPVIFLYFNMHPLFDLCPRFFVPMFPYMLIMAAVAALELKDRFARAAAPSAPRP
jgi:4-amino-4-deoxy-L-arabinose transferase-like glycosyltransferase